MSKHYRKKARQIVDRFIGDLDDTTRASVGEEKLDSLAMRIESALSAAVLEELEQVADNLDGIAHKLRRHAEAYDD